MRNIQSKRKESYFRIFSRKHIVLYVGVVLALMIPLCILLAVFSDGFRNFEAWKDFSAWGSIVAGIATYLGAALLAIVSYFNTWVHQYKDEELHYDISSTFIYKGELSNFFTADVFPWEEKKYVYEFSESLEDRKYGFKRLTLNNLNRVYPMRIRLLKVALSIDEGEFADCTEECVLATDFPMYDSVEYKQENHMLLGISETLLQYRYDTQRYHTHSLKVAFEISNPYNTEVCEYQILNNDSENLLRVLSEEEAKVLQAKELYVQYHVNDVPVSKKKGSN